MCTLHLLTGLLAGAVVVWLAIRADHSATANAEETQNLLQFYRTAYERLAMHAAKLGSLAENDVDQISAPIMAAVRSLSNSTRDFQFQLKQAESRHLGKSMRLADDPQALNSHEIRSLLAARPAGLEDEDEPDGERFTYRVSQWMARCIGSRLPDVKEFEPVMCQDLSPKRVSFYSDDVPVGQHVVMAIGGPDQNTVFVIAEATHRRVAHMDDKPTYLVGCRFRRRLTQPKDGEAIAQYRLLPAIELAAHER